MAKSEFYKHNMEVLRRSLRDGKDFTPKERNVLEYIFSKSPDFDNGAADHNVKEKI